LFTVRDTPLVVFDKTERVPHSLVMTKTVLYLTTAEVAHMIRVDTSTVRRWAIQGLLPSSCLPGGHYRFRPQDVEAFLEGQAVA